MNYSTILSEAYSLHNISRAALPRDGSITKRTGWELLQVNLKDKAGQLWTIKGDLPSIIKF